MIDILKRLRNRLNRTPGLEDGRSGKVIFVPHCMLNQNSRVAGTAVWPAAMFELAIGLIEREIGIIQMPCPELFAFGVNRANICVERELRIPAFRSINRRLARDLVQQVKSYVTCGIRVIGVLGKNGSPSCGVEETWFGGILPGSGVFIEELAAELKEQRIALEMTGIRDDNLSRAIEAVDGWLLKAEHYEFNRG